jgi:hypothetical protein
MMVTLINKNVILVCFDELQASNEVLVQSLVNAHFYEYKLKGLLIFSSNYLQVTTNYLR